MANQTRLRSADLIAMLRILSLHVRNGAGWSRKGVRGWVFTDEFAEPLASVHLAELARRGFIVREDVRDPWRNLPLYLHRITQAGENEVAAAEGRDPFPVPGRRGVSIADRETIYVPTGAWDALSALSREPESDPWRTLAQIADRANTPVFAEHPAYLVARTLAEVRRPLEVSPSSPLLYRATALGRAARARDLTTSNTRVQIRVPGLPTDPE